ncbi:hypothetical protein EKE57_002580 [Escherichia coli]|nr:hypothetical protein [Escherichia coli]
MAEHDEFPAPAGINRHFIMNGGNIVGVPRASGDKPRNGAAIALEIKCSPRQRG